MWSDLAGPWARSPFIRCRDADGSVREHCTRWDASPVHGDRVVSQPPGVLPLRDLSPERARAAVPPRAR